MPRTLSDDWIIGLGVSSGGLALVARGADPLVAAQGVVPDVPAVVGARTERGALVVDVDGAGAGAARPVQGEVPADVVRGRRRVDVEDLRVRFADLVREVALAALHRHRRAALVQVDRERL